MSGRWARFSAAGLGLALFIACSGEQKAHPPPEGEWLEWKPKKRDDDKFAKAKPPPEDEPVTNGKSKKKEKGDNPDEKGKGKTSSKPKPPPVTCTGQDVVKEGYCVSQTELGAVECPEKIPKTSQAKISGVINAPTKDSKRDPSLEESSKMCCYAWCSKVPSVALDSLTCKSPEVASPLWCFEAPAGGTKTPAAGAYGECPAGLKKQTNKGINRAIPAAGFSAKETKDERVSSPKVCCYETCKKP